MIQCQNHNSHDIKGACRCVTVKVIMPVAVTAVSSCSINVRIQLYSPNGSTGLKNGRAKFFSEYLSTGAGEFMYNRI